MLWVMTKDLKFVYHIPKGNVQPPVFRRVDAEVGKWISMMARSGKQKLFDCLFRGEGRGETAIQKKPFGL